MAHTEKERCSSHHSLCFTPTASVTMACMRMLAAVQFMHTEAHSMSRCTRNTTLGHQRPERLIPTCTNNRPSSKGWDFSRKTTINMLRTLRVTHHREQW